MKIQLRFHNVGRAKRSWDAEVETRAGSADGDFLDELEVLATRQVRRHGGLASRYPDVSIAKDGTGVVLAGFHTVGAIEWETMPIETPAGGAS